MDDRSLSERPNSTGLQEPSDLQLTDKQWNILDAALAVFTEKGFSAATTSEIARQAGVSEGTIFRHFKTKKDILLAMLVPLIRNTMGPKSVNSLTQMIVKNENLPLREVLLMIALERQDFLLENQALLRLILTEAQYHPELREAIIGEVAYKSQEQLIRLIEQRQQKGEIRQDLPAWVLVRSFFGMVVVYMLSGVMLTKREAGKDNREEILKIIDLFLNGAVAEK
ncbi:helix-turn-helix transcriptional regulator [Heliobacterium chlorum]|uniref:Helix-turn-helix transcriptional regulator n=1 Tax=Heliobacterium chlorum TaxID=2698 RepID=A0ABR7T580_HELCL|nr:TetR/AcrR family transcriptional regulator [Heliobacterium chlorum]MBC9785382.1 helix-turn-helix transcriptional regulator [Heliobacterium chlorum]